MYTVRTENGQRDLTNEMNLSRLEGEFARLRRNKLEKHLPLTTEEHLYLCMFAAAMIGRTPSYAEHTSGEWQRVLDMGERMQQARESATEAQRANMATLPPTPGTSEENRLSMEEARKVVEQPIQETLGSVVTGVGPLLLEVPFVIIETSVAPGFITSDDPCVWHDSANYLTPVPRGAGGLGSPTIEVTMPLSPNQMIMFGHRHVMPGIYLPVTDQGLVNALNKRTRIKAYRYFVANRPTVRADWF
jgi:hypothetical protein